MKEHFKKWFNSLPAGDHPKDGEEWAWEGWQAALESRVSGDTRDKALEEAAEICKTWNTTPGSRLAAEILALKSESRVLAERKDGPVNLEGLRAKLLAPREIKRDDEGWLTHPDFPVCDEGTHAGKFLEAFGIEAKFVSMDSDDPEGAERYFEAGEPDCSYWTPTTPTGDGWILLEIYDTEDGPYAMFGRDAYEAEQARKREHTRKLAEAVRERRIAAIDRARQSGEREENKK
jgi:hypothetical protein